MLSCYVALMLKALETLIEYFTMAAISRKHVESVKYCIEHIKIINYIRTTILKHLKVFSNKSPSGKYDWMIPNINIKWLNSRGFSNVTISSNSKAIAMTLGTNESKFFALVCSHRRCTVSARFRPRNKHKFSIRIQNCRNWRWQFVVFRFIEQDPIAIKIQFHLFLSPPALQSLWNFTDRIPSWSL